MRRSLLLLLVFVAAGCGDTKDETKTLKFTAIPDQNTTRLKQKYDPVAEYLEKKLGFDVEYVPAVDYKASVEMFKNGDIHMAWFGGLTGVQARQDVPGAKAIAQGAEDPEFYSYFIANASTGLERSEEFPAEIAGMTFTFGSRDSTSGRLMPEFFIMENTGKSAEEFFENMPSYSGSHDKTAEAVENGSFQAGVLNYQVYDRRVKEGQTDPEKCRIIWQTPVYADYNITVHPDVNRMFGEGTIEKIQEALVAMDDPDLLSAFGRSKLIPAKNEDFEGIRQVAMKVGMLR